MQVIGGLAATALAERLPPGRTLAAAAIILGAITLTIGVAPGPAPIRFAVLCAAFGFVWLFMMPFHIGLALRVDPAGQVAMLAPAAQLTGSAFGPLVVSLIVVGDDAGPAPFVSAASRWWRSPGSAHWRWRGGRDAPRSPVEAVSPQVMAHGAAHSRTAQEVGRRDRDRVSARGRGSLRTSRSSRRETH